MNIRKNAALFGLGGSAYVGLELLWRGRSHGSMFCAGGLCFTLLGKLEKKPLPMPIRVLAGAGAITAVELGTGLLVNRDHKIWDYRQNWGNYRGQICPAYSLLWIPVAAAGMQLHRWLDRKI